MTRKVALYNGNGGIAELWEIEIWHEAYIRLTRQRPDDKYPQYLIICADPGIIELVEKEHEALSKK